MIDSDKLKEIKDRFHSLNELLADPAIASDPKRMASLGPEHRELSEVVEAIELYESVLEQSLEMQELILTEVDTDLVALAREELDMLTERLPKLEETLQRVLIPKDPEDTRDAIVEIRAGTGGSEAALFVADLYSPIRTLCIPKGMEVNPHKQLGWKCRWIQGNHIWNFRNQCIW